MEKTVRQKESWRNLILGLHSLSIFLISYFLLYIISGLSVLYIAYDFDIPAKLFINTIVFDLPDESPLWTTDAIISILMATPVSSFITGIIALFVFLVVAKKNAFLLFFSLWIFLQAFNMTFGLLSENIISQTGLVRVAREMGLKSIMLLLTVGLSFFFMVKSGMLAGKLFVAHAEFAKNITFKKKIIKTVVFFILPWLTGSLILFVITNETLEAKNIILSIFMLILLVPTLFTATPQRLKPLPFPKRFPFFLMSLAIMVIFFSVFILKRGFSF